MSERHPSAPPTLETPTTLTFDSSPPTPYMTADKDKPSAHTSLSTLVSNLPDGCHYGQLPAKDGDEDAPAQRVIWVEFPPNSPDNPFYFHRGRKAGITFVAIFFTLMAGACAPRRC